MDPLSDVLSLLKPKSYATGGFHVGETMAIQWPTHAGTKCYAVVWGECWLSVDEVRDPILLRAGDCYLLPPGPPFRLASDLSLATVDFRTLRHKRTSNGDVPDNSDGFYLVGGHFVLTGGQADILLKSLPP